MAEDVEVKVEGKTKRARPPEMDSILQVMGAMFGVVFGMAFQAIDTKFKFGCSALGFVIVMCFYIAHFADKVRTNESDLMVGFGGLLFVATAITASRFVPWVEPVKIGIFLLLFVAGFAILIALGRMRAKMDLAEGTAP